MLDYPRLGPGWTLGWLFLGNINWFSLAAKLKAEEAGCGISRFASEGAFEFVVILLPCVLSTPSSSPTYVGASALILLLNALTPPVLDSLKETFESSEAPLAAPMTDGSLGIAPVSFSEE